MASAFINLGPITSAATSSKPIRAGESGFVTFFVDGTFGSGTEACVAQISADGTNWHTVAAIGGLELNTALNAAGRLVILAGPGMLARVTASGTTNGSTNINVKIPSLAGGWAVDNG